MNQQRVKYKTLIIVESPSKCRTIEKLLGPGYMCVASCGHIREISDGLTGLHLDTILSDPEWMPTYTTISKKLHHIRSIKNAISDCNGTILLGTDADREGEAIAWHICQHFGLPVETTPRITFNEITQTALECAIRNPRVVDMQLVRAQQARQVLDLMIGYKITPLLWKSGSSIPNKNKKQILSAGRCQTPALRLVYDNDVENRALSLHPKYYYKCVAYFTSHNIGFSLSRELELEEIEPFLKFYTNADNIRHVFRVDPDIKRIAQSAPTPLKTSTLQQLANSKYGLTSSETMESAQLLYERGLITYHRTDVTQLSQEFREKANQYIERKWGKEYINMKESFIKPQHVAHAHAHAHAHEAIRPIDVALTADKAKIISRSSLIGGDVSDMSTNECRIYHLIWIRAVQSCMPPATCDKLTARIKALMGEQVMYEYTHNAFRPVFAGWRACGLSDNDTENDRENDTEKEENPNPMNNKSYFDFLLSLKPDSILPYNSISCITELRNGPKHYTEGGLIKRMEHLGIGRPSTFASIMHTLRKREFVVKRDIIRNIGTHFDCVNYTISHDSKVSASGPKVALRGDNSQYEFGIERNKLQLTDAGRMVVETLIPRCDGLFAYDYTTKMEVALDAVALDAVALDAVALDAVDISAAGNSNSSNNYNYNWREVCRECLRNIDAVIMTKNQMNENSENSSDVVANSDECSEIGILRAINKYASIRDGKYGAYIFYKPPKYKKPKFISLKGFPHNALKCEDVALIEWIEEHA